MPTAQPTKFSIVLHDLLKMAAFCCPKIKIIGPANYTQPIKPETQQS